MLKKSLLIIAMAAAAASSAHAQSANASPAKKELIGKILKIQQPGIEALARNLAERPAVELLAAADNMANRVPADKREAVAKEIHADTKKYLDETIPLVRDRALKLAPSTVGTLLEEKFSEDELKQVLGFMESPVYRKFQSLGDDMQKVLIEKLVADARPTVEPKVKALEASVAKRLGLPPQGAAAPQSGAKPAAKPASK
jgi:hypothetical protein